jgi:Protein of unknown function (Hypoth_ymh)
LEIADVDAALNSPGQVREGSRFPGVLHESASTWPATAPAAGLSTGTPDWTSQHEGAGFLGMGCAQAIRNLTTHGAQPDEQTALEQLATLSLLARLIDKAQQVV